MKKKYFLKKRDDIQFKHKYASIPEIEIIEFYCL